MKRRFVKHEIEYSDLHEARGVFIRPVFIYVLVGKSFWKEGTKIPWKLTLSLLFGEIYRVIYVKY